MGSFLDYAEKRSNYVNCLSDVLNYIERHSISLKQAKLLNEKGIKKILNALINNVDKFVEEGDEIELTVTDKGEVV